MSVDAWTRVSKSVAYVIAADEIKKDIEGYDPAHWDQFHQASAKMADKMYDEAVKRRSERKVILLAGGAASGKSEYLSLIHIQMCIRDSRRVIQTAGYL